MARLRLQYAESPRPVIELTDTPNPKCSACEGIGGWTEDYGDYDTGEYAGTETVHCTCWDPWRIRRLLPVPRWLARRWLGWTEPVYSAEPPF
ncbi:MULTISPECIES: hypothetical protein [Streptomyces]|uniref:hypothetical protein n=1 Tax=Streptomyces TaxID=1883 RepID=UPI00052497ED|nr:MULTISPECIES: hypothetical protein [Streptomyces]